MPHRVGAGGGRGARAGAAVVLRRAGQSQEQLRQGRRALQAAADLVLAGM